MLKTRNCLFALLFILGCQNQEIDIDTTNEIISCIQSRDEMVFNHLLDFEKYLLQKKYVQKDNLISYIEFIPAVFDEDITIDDNGLNDFIYGDIQKNMFFPHPNHISIIKKCIDNSDIKVHNHEFYEALIYVLSIRNREAAIRVAEENNIEFYPQDFDFKSMDNDYLNNQLFKLCLLWGIFPYM